LSVFYTIATLLKALRNITKFW